MKIGFILVGLMFLTSVRFVVAQSYGQGEDQAQLIVDKKIRMVPSTEIYDNIDKNLKVFYKNDMLEFSVLVKNSGNTVLEDIKLVDELPQNLNLLFYPGDYDESGNAVGWSIEKLEAGESKTYLIRAKISDNLVESQRCNQAMAWAGELTDSDTACYFVGVGAIPDTGDAGLIFKTIVATLTVGLGVGLRKFARGY